MSDTNDTNRTLQDRRERYNELTDAMGATAAISTDRALQALHERYAQLTAELATMDHNRAALVARMDENRQSLDLVQRNGRKKPGPKGRPSEDEKPIPQFLRRKPPAETMVAATADAMMPTYTEDAP